MRLTNISDSLLQYSPSWLWIVWPLVGVAVLIIVGMFIFTRKLKRKHDVLGLDPLLSTPEMLSAIKNLYAQEVSQVGEQFKSGTISQRVAFQHLSVLLRNFTHEYSKTLDHTSTLVELKTSGAPDLLVDRIKEFYPPAFQKAEKENNVLLAVNDALMVIQKWH